MRRTWVIIAAIVVLVPIVFVVALSLIPDSVYRDRISAAVKDATGRDLTIGGKIGISFIPTLGVSAENVALSNAEGFSAPSFATMKSLQAGVALLPLLSGKVEITKFSLIEPAIALEIDAQGHNNWTFHGKNAPAEPPPPTEPAQQSGAPGAGLGSLSLGKVELVNGQVSFADRQKNTSWAITAINVTLSLPSLDQPMDLDGKATWKGKEVTLTLNAQNPRQILNGVSAPLTLKVDSDLLKASLDGAAAAGTDMHLSGKADLSVTSVRDLSAWLAKPMAPGQGFGPLAIKGDVAYQADEIDFTNASVNFDKIDGTGQVVVKTGGARPYVKAQLAVGTLDVNPYLGGGAQGGGAGGAGAPAPAPAAAGGWSTERMDFSGLKAIDGDFAFQAKTIRFKKLTFTDSVMAMSLKGGVLTADLTKLQLYGGGGKAKIVLDGSGATPGLQTDLAFTGINIEPFLKDGANFDRLSGTGNLTLSVRGQGSSQKALAQSLGGSGALNLVNGAIRGINLAAMVRNVSGAFAGIAGGNNEKTDFASLAGTWTISSGVLSNNDLQLLNPLLRVNGAGTANIGERTVDYVVTPKAVADLQGQGGKTDVTGYAVPVRVTGSWDNLRFAPDTKGLIQGALKGALDAKGAGQDPLKGALKGLLGQPGAKSTPPANGGAQPAPQPAKKKEKPADKLLNDILGGH